MILGGRGTGKFTLNARRIGKPRPGQRACGSPDTQQQAVRLEAQQAGPGGRRAHHTAALGPARDRTAQRRQTPSPHAHKRKPSPHAHKQSPGPHAPKQSSGLARPTQRLTKPSHAQRRAQALTRTRSAHQALTCDLASDSAAPRARCAAASAARARASAAPSSFSSRLASWCALRASACRRGTMRGGAGDCGRHGWVATCALCLASHSLRWPCPSAQHISWCQEWRVAMHSQGESTMAGSIEAAGRPWHPLLRPPAWHSAPRPPAACALLPRSATLQPARAGGGQRGGAVIASCTSPPWL